MLPAPGNMGGRKGEGNRTMPPGLEKPCGTGRTGPPRVRHASIPGGTGGTQYIKKLGLFEKVGQLC